MSKKLMTLGAIALLSSTLIPFNVAAEDGISFVAFARSETVGAKGGSKGGNTSFVVPELQSWMHEDVGAAWNDGYLGQGTTITFIDDFSSNGTIGGNLGTGQLSMSHGYWTSLEGSMIAPEASIQTQDFNNYNSVTLARRGLNVLNLSYGMMGAPGFTDISWGGRESSIIDYATNGKAVVVKAAGNGWGAAVDGVDNKGRYDYLNADLIGADSVIFVGAMNAQGSVENPKPIAGYSTIAGDNIDVQEHFVMVGVEGIDTGLVGTSFAAPIVSGYAAILGSKFKRATPIEITNRILDTAREDTVLDYNPAIHGQGEASLSRALAPDSIR